MADRPPLTGSAPLRWDLADDPDVGAQGALFSPVRREVGRGEFQGMEFLHVEAKRILNEVKGSGPASPGGLPFRWTINPYRGCSHACSYCLTGDTAVLMADGTTKAMRDVRPGDGVYGTERRGAYRRYVATTVLDHWSTVRAAWRVTLADGTTLITSRDHRFLTERGWRHVAAAPTGGHRPYLTTNNTLMGVGHLPVAPKHDDDFRRGYLCGMIRSDATMGRYVYVGRGRSPEVRHTFRLAPADAEARDRSERWLGEAGVESQRFEVSARSERRGPVSAVRAQSRSACEIVSQVLEWPDEDPGDSWSKGFLSGIFDAKGSAHGVLRICHSDDEMIRRTCQSLRRFGFDSVIENLPHDHLRNVSILGGFRERLRFFLLVDPAITRKRTFDGLAMKSDADLRVMTIEALGIDLPMYDITTGTGDFVAEGVISHNCFARPTHTYLGLDAGADFDQRVVVKVNAPERLRAELAPARWAGELVAMGTNTDPYQRCEAKYRLTHRLIEVLIEARNPFSILTKSTLILRDLDLLSMAASHGLVRVSLSVGTVDEDVWRTTEPGTPPPGRRLRAVRRLNDAGIPTGVLIGPVLPGLSDAPQQLQAVGLAAVEAGAVSIGHVVLHLRSPETRAVYLERLAASDPDAAATTDRLYRSGNAPKADRERIAATLRAAIESAGGHLGAMEPPPSAVQAVELRARVARSKRPTGDGGAQLPLPL